MTWPLHSPPGINAVGARLRETLRRCDPPWPKSLRLIAVRVVKDWCLRRLAGHPEIHPGMRKLASWGGCSERQARRDVRLLEAWGLMVPLSDAKGGNRSTRYRVDVEALIRRVMRDGANPHPDLMADLRDLARGRTTCQFGGEADPGHEAGRMSAGSKDPRANPAWQADRLAMGSKT